MANVGFATMQVIPSMRGVGAAMQSQMASPATAAGASAGTVFGRGFGGVLGPALIAGGAVVAVGGVLAAVGSSFDEAFDNIRTKTGATGEALEGLKDTFRGVVADVPNDFNEVSDAVAELHQRLDITGKPLEELSEQVLHLSNLTGEDLNGVIDDSTRLFGDWGVATEDQSETLDKLFRASQASGTSVSELAQQVVQFGSPLRQLGFSLDESLALFANFEQAGVNTSTAMSGMRQAVAKFAARGLEPMEGFAWVMGEVEKGTFSLDEAMSVFGARAGADMFAALQEGKFDLEDLIETIQNGSDSIQGAADDTYDWREALDQLKNRGMLLLEPVAVRVFDGLSNLADSALDLSTTFGEQGLTGVMTQLKDGFTDLEGPMQGVLIGLGAISTAFVALRVAAIAAWAAAFAPFIIAATPVILMLGALGLAIYLLREPLRWLWENVITQIIPALQSFGRMLNRGRDQMVDMVGGAMRAFGRAWDWMATRSRGARQVIGAAISAVIGAVGRLGGSVTRGRQIIGTAISGIIGWFRDLPGRASNALGRLPAILTTAGRVAMRGMRNGLEGVWGNTRDWLTSIPGAAARAVGNLGSILYDVGRSVIQGLWDGMQSVWDDVTGWLSGLNPANFFNDINPAKGHAEKNLVPVGKSVFEGLHRGMQDEWANTARWLRTIDPASEVQAGTFGFSGGRPVTAGRSGQAAITADITLRVEPEGMLKVVRKEVRVGGGNVQTVLGP